MSETISTTAGCSLANASLSASRKARGYKRLTSHLIAIFVRSHVGDDMATAAE